MTPQLTQIGIIGAGELGLALGDALTRARTQILYYDTDSARTTTASIEDLVRACPVLFLCVPSWAMHDVLHAISKAANPIEPRLVVSFSKGVEPKFVTMDHILAERLPSYYRYGLLYGPIIAEEVARGHSAYGVLALGSGGRNDVLMHLLARAGIFVEPSNDIRGIALCAVLKNIYAIALGMCDGLRLGLNAKGKLGVMILAEMKQLVTDLGAHPKIVEGTAGLGDLLATGFSEESFNYRVGKSLAEGIASEHVKSEGLVALQELSHKVKLARYPIANALSQATFHYAKPQIIADLLQTPQ